MRRGYKILALAAVLLLLTAVWWWRYDSLNSYYREYAGLEREYVSPGGTLYFGEDYIDTGLRARGYTLRLTDFEIVDFAEYAELTGYTEELVEPPERLALAEVVLGNEGSPDPGVMLTELTLHGLDFYTDMNFGLLQRLNPVLEGSGGISLPEGTEYRLLLPYNLRGGAALDGASLSIQATAYPTTKELVLVE